MENGSGKVTSYQKYETVTIPREQINFAFYNPRKMSDENKRNLRDVIKEVGIVEPVIWNKRTGNLVGGHQRLKILKKGLSSDDKLEVSVVHLPERKEKMLNIALNKISGDWDNYLLKSLLEDISLEDFEMDIIGFDSKEVNSMLGKLEEHGGEDVIEEFFGIYVECNTEEHQMELLAKFEGEGLKCRALIS